MTGTAYAGHLGLHELAKLRQWRCTYCEGQTHCRVCNPHLDGRLAATRDHVIARSRGGPSNRRNLVLACQDCNQRKGAGVPGDDLPDTFAPVSRPRVDHTAVLGGPWLWRACGDSWHKTEQQADLAARALLRATGRSFGSYQCVYCQRWHLAPAESVAVNS